VFAGDGTRPRLESAPRRVTVLARLNLSLDRARLRRGWRVRASGVADPATHVRISLRRRSRRGWVTERKRTIAVRDGVYRIRLRPRFRGRYRISSQVGRVVRRRSLTVV
jgi:hypothetical protein